MIELGRRAPDFELVDTDGQLVSLSDFDRSPALLVMFISNHCPFVHHVRAELARIADDYSSKGVGVVAIMSNDVETHPGDHPDLMATEKVTHGYGFPYLYDESQEVAKAYSAACTPDFYLFDSDRTLVYRGQLDDSRPGSSIPVTGSHLRSAIDDVLAGEVVATEQKPSLGCNIKWRPGNEPDYFG